MSNDFRIQPESKYVIDIKTTNNYYVYNSRE